VRYDEPEHVVQSPPLAEERLFLPVLFCITQQERTLHVLKRAVGVPACEIDRSQNRDACDRMALGIGCGCHEAIQIGEM